MSDVEVQLVPYRVMAIDEPYAWDATAQGPAGKVEVSWGIAEDMYYMCEERAPENLPALRACLDAIEAKRAEGRDG